MYLCVNVCSPTHPFQHSLSHGSINMEETIKDHSNFKCNHLLINDAYTDQLHFSCCIICLNESLVCCACSAFNHHSPGSQRSRICTEQFCFYGCCLSMHSLYIDVYTEQFVHRSVIGCYIIHAAITW